jgi:hypothetical protein
MTPLFNDFAIMCDYWAFKHVFSRSPEGVLTFTDAEKCDPKLTQQCYGLMSFPYDEFYIDRIITFVSSSQEEKRESTGPCIRQCGPMGVVRSSHQTDATPCKRA